MSRAKKLQRIDGLQTIRDRLEEQARERWPRATPWELDEDDEPTQRVIHTIFIGEYAPCRG